MAASGSNRAGIAWILATTLSWCCTDALAKHLGQTYPQVQITWVRCLVQTAILMIWFAPRLREVLRTRRPGAQLFRSAMMAVGSVFTFFAVSHLPLALVSTVTALTPVIVTVLAASTLSEVVGARRWASVGIGLVGALVVIGPGGFELSFAVVLPVIAVVGNSIYQVMTRRLRDVDPVETTLLYSAFVGSAAGFVVAPFALVGTLPMETVWVEPDFAGWVGLVGMGVGALIGHTFMTMAYTAAPASVVAPFFYAGIVWAAVLGFTLFGEIPAMTTLAGAAIIVAAGFNILFAEKRAEPQPTIARARST